MRHQVHKVKMGTDKDHKISLMRNLAISVIIHEKIKTTNAKAHDIQPFVEHLIHIAKTKTGLGAIREFDSLLNHEDSSRKLIEVLKERYKEKTSGFTRITKLGNRKGDNAPLVQLELIN